MSTATDVVKEIDLLSSFDPVWRRQGKKPPLKPVMLQESRTTTPLNSQATDVTEATPLRSFVAPLVNASVLREVWSDTTPLEVWEGTVITVDREAGVMRVVLDAKIGRMPRHTADIDIDEVSAQDYDLMLPGAVFYLTLYKRSVPSVENVQELRFRRRPSWSAAQLHQIDKDASAFLSKMRPLPSAA